jgi:hypothetical protein
MALRDFRDASGRTWWAWDTYPALAERRKKDEPRPPGAPERRRVSSPRVVLPGDLVNGWLTFESGPDRKRLVPVPDGWEQASEEQLRRWMDEATPLPPARRLIE